MSTVVEIRGIDAAKGLNTVTRAWLQSDMNQKFGKVINVKKPPTTGDPAEDVAFVEFARPEDAEKAVDMLRRGMSVGDNCQVKGDFKSASGSSEKGRNWQAWGKDSDDSRKIAQQLRGGSRRSRSRSRSRRDDRRGRGRDSHDRGRQDQSRRGGRKSRSRSRRKSRSRSRSRRKSRSRGRGGDDRNSGQGGNRAEDGRDAQTKRDASPARQETRRKRMFDDGPASAPASAPPASPITMSVFTPAPSGLSGPPPAGPTFAGALTLQEMAARLQQAKAGMGAMR